MRFQGIIIHFILFLSLLSITVSSPAELQVDASDNNLTLEYSTFFGGGGEDDGYSVAFDDENNIYLTGSTASSDFPITDDALLSTQPSTGTRTGYVAEFSTSGELLYSSYLGGKGTDTGTEIALDSENNIYVAGITRSSDFPITDNATDTTYGGGTAESPLFCCGDGFITKFAPNWTVLYSSYIGGSDSEADIGLFIDNLDNVYISGMTRSTDLYTTPNAYQTSNNGKGDLFVTKMLPNGTIVFSTYLGGSGDEIRRGGGTNGKSITVDSEYNIYITEASESTDFPTTTDALNQNSKGGIETVFTKLNSDGTSLLYSTYIGGPNDDGGSAIGIDSADNIYLLGTIDSEDLPNTSGSFQDKFGGGGCLIIGGAAASCGDAYIIKFSAESGDFTSTYLGGEGFEVSTDIFVTKEGKILVTGFTDSLEFPVTGMKNFDSNHGGYDIFVSQVDSTTFELETSFLIGGSREDQPFQWEIGNGITVNSLGEIFFTGFSFADDFPITTDGYDTTHNGDKDIVLVKFIQSSETQSNSSKGPNALLQWIVLIYVPVYGLMRLKRKNS